MEAGTADQSTAELHGSNIISAVKASGVEFILSVPDIHTSAGLLRPIANDPDFRLIRVCKEDECIGIASGMHYTDRRALVLIQYTGMQTSKAGRAFKGFEVYVAGDGALAEPVQPAGSSRQAESPVADGDQEEV